MQNGVVDNLVSIIIPTYNRAYCLPQTLRSVLAQTHTHWEAIIIDDGSTDGTSDLIAQEFGHDPRVRYLHQANAGVSAARNTGMRAARGEFVAFLDSDDLWYPWKLEAQVACLRHYPHLGMVWTEMEAIDPSGEVFDRRHLRTMYSAYRLFTMESLFQSSVPLSDVTAATHDPDARLYMGDIYASMIRGSLVHTSTVMLRSDRLQEVVGFAEDLKSSGEDFDFHLRTCRAGAVGLLDLPSIQYQKGRGDQLSNDSFATARNFLTTVERAVAADRELHRLSPSSIREVLSEAHNWIAEESFAQGDLPAVRRHALESLRRHPRQARLLLLLVTAWLPTSSVQSLKSTFRSLKGRYLRRAS